jgi:hypothetical protein
VTGDWELTWLRARFRGWEFSRGGSDTITARHPGTGQVISDQSAAVIEFRLRVNRDEGQVAQVRPQPWLDRTR